MFRQKKAVIVLLAAVISFSMLLSGCSTSGASEASKEKITLKIGYLPITHAVPLFMEDDFGKEGFENFELELVKFGSWPDLTDALNAGKIDGASMLVTLAMAAKEQGIDIKAVALGHRDGNVLVTSKDVGETADLKGADFAIPHRFSTHNILLYLMLKQANMPYSDVNPIQLAPAEMPASLAQGSVSGYVVAEPFGAIAVNMGQGKVLYQDNQIWANSIDCALILRGELIRKHPEVAQAFVNEYVKAGEAAEKKDEHTREVAKTYMNVDDEVLKLSFEWIKYDDLRVNEDSFNELREYMVEMGLSENPPTFEDFVDNSLFDNAKK